MLALLTIASVACTRTDRPAPRPRPTPSDATIRFGYPWEPSTLDPLGPGGAGAATRDILRPVLPALFRLTAGLTPEPELAARWPAADEITESPHAVTLELRPARWSDGRPITAEDVRFSWHQLRRGPTGYRYRFVTDVQALDERRVRIVFSRPMRRWWSLFSLDDMVLPAHAYSPKWERGPTVSGGPFKVASWTPGLRVRLERNERYWGDPAVPRVIDVLFVGDEETRLQLLERGELEGLYAEGEVNMGRRSRARGWEPTTAALDGSGQASGVWGPTWWEISVDTSRVSARVAQAATEALDSSLVAEILEDSGEVMDGIPSSFPAFPPLRGPWAAARGRPGRVRGSFQLMHPRGSTAGAIARFAYFRLREAGIAADLVDLEQAAFERRLTSGGRPAVVLRLRRGSDAPDAGAYAPASGRPGAAAAAAEAIDAAETTQALVTKQRGVGRGPWETVQRELASAQTVEPLARVRTWIVGRKGLAGPNATGASHGPLWNAATWAFTGPR